MNANRLFIIVLSIALSVSARAGADELLVRPHPSKGVLEIGQRIVWRLQWQGSKPPKEVHYQLKRGGKTEIRQGTLELVEGEAELTASLDTPGALLALFSATSAAGEKVLGRGGAIVAPQEIKPSAARPADFDSFWAAKLKEIAAIPLHAQLESADSGRKGVDYWKITLDGYGGSKIRGQLARPDAEHLKAGDKLPALFIPQWAGVYPLEKPWVTDRAAEGWLVLNILAHDLPIDEPKSFYDAQFQGPLKDYWAIGNDDRETS
jgi:hypothetical protein